MRLIIGYCLFFLWITSFSYAKPLYPHSLKATAQEQVILLHGYGRSASVMKRMKLRFEKKGYRVHIVEYSSLMQSIEGIEKEVDQKINQVLDKSHLITHFVGHSLGGLLVRSYLGRHKPKHLGKVVTLGSPNKGTPVVDHLSDKWWTSFMGSAMQALSAKGSLFLSRLPKPDYPLGIIAGLTKHVFIGKTLQEPHDGLVPLSSTKVEGMTDFIIIKVNHAALRYHRKVFKEVLYFIKNGFFKHS